jgi:spore coat polysaccharide biosynthesis protein SpsF
MTTACIIQARFGSSRLPGKVLRPLGRRTPLAAVLSRCARIPGVDVVVCAVPDDRPSDAVAEAARGYGATVFRGSEQDVLDRYYQAARAVGATIVMRVTSDCPLIDPQLCGRVLQRLGETGADYACNNLPPLWPHGLDCEAFAFSHLARAAAEARLPYDREHVTPWLRRHAGLRRINLEGPGGGLERHRWTLDYPEDLAFFTALWAVLGERAEAAATTEIVAALDRHPDIVAINRARVDEQRLRPRPSVAALRA